ncbi:PREDICTED: transmembrane protease serine 11E-like [Nicrophorus vespilloides]|uniref:Transmembrane protease serine 11E-like n=1 Tax=Nicrophorus vespilloides TaxID=110193 RepID=A0ABM1M616_NICVS|nr:PREDICTED: transmembrane protease serine 11E-like [Nicrophorus vespilloides]
MSGSTCVLKLLIFVALCELFVAQKTYPCPGIFHYEPRAKDEIDRWTGIISISSSEELHGVWIHLTLDRPVNVLLNWFGQASSADNKEFVIKNPAYLLEPGPTVNVKIQVIYSPTEIVPSVTRIRLNGRTVCNEGVPVRTTEAPSPFISQKITKKPATASSAINRPSQTSNNGNLLSQSASRRPSSTSTALPSTTSSDTFFTGELNHIINTRKPNKPGVTLSNDVRCGTVAKRGNALITNGQDVKEGSWPWHVALYVSDGLQLRYICGGNLVRHKYVITAAHCVTRPGTNRKSDAEGFLVHLGRTFLRTFGPGIQERRVERITIHPEYNNTYLQNDVAVLKLSRDADYTDYVRPVCLWSDAADDSVIGKLERQITDTLQEAQMPVIDTLTCIFSNPDFYSKYTSTNTLCAGFRNGTSVCNGDSGGGMFFSKTTSNGEVWELRGLVSVSLALQGKYCDPYNYVVFSDLAHHKQWLNSVLTV